MGLIGIETYLIISVIAVIAGIIIRKRLGKKLAKKVVALLYIISIVCFAIGFIQRYHDGQLVKKFLQAQEIWETAEQITGDDVESAVIADIWKDKKKYEAILTEKEPENREIRSSADQINIHFARERCRKASVPTPKS